jgi:prophage regulatory protein
MKENILNLLMTDPGQLTLGQLLQQREAARIEIQKLTQELEALKAKMAARAPEKSASLGKNVQSAYVGNALIGIGDLCKQIGVSRTTIYRWVKEGTFPAAVRISVGAVRWRSQDVEQWRTSLPPTKG